MITVDGIPGIYRHGLKNNASAQKQSSLVIYLPPDIQKEKLDITFNNGKERKYFNVKGDSNSITIREAFYPDQAVLTLHYPSETPYYPYYAVYYRIDQHVQAASIP